MWFLAARSWAKAPCGIQGEQARSIGSISWRAKSIVSILRPAGYCMRRFRTPWALLPFDEQGGLVAAMGRGFYDVDFATGEAKLIAEVEPDLPENRMNDGKPDRQGRFWAGSMHTPETRADRRPLSARRGPAVAAHGRGRHGVQCPRLESGRQDDVLRRQRCANGMGLGLRHRKRRDRQPSRLPRRSGDRRARRTAQLSTPRLSTG